MLPSIIGLYVISGLILVGAISGSTVTTVVVSKKVKNAKARKFNSTTNKSKKEAKLINEEITEIAEKKVIQKTNAKKYNMSIVISRKDDEPLKFSISSDYIEDFVKKAKNKHLSVISNAVLENDIQSIEVNSLINGEQKAESFDFSNGASKEAYTKYKSHIGGILKSAVKTEDENDKTNGDENNL